MRKQFIWTCAFILLLPLSLLAQDRNAAALARNNTSAVHGTRNGNAEPASTSTLPIRSLLYPGATTKIFVRLMQWWGDPKHIDIGYRSDDERQVDRQITDMEQRGIDGAIVDWYGPGDTPRNRAMDMLLRRAEQDGRFLVAASVDVGALRDCIKHGCNETQEITSLINYVTQHYGRSSAYWRVNNRPVVTFFGLEKHDIDWHRVRSGLRDNPMLIFRNSGGFSTPESDGAFAWIAAETVKPSDPIAEEYLERFYTKAQQSGGKLTIGAVYKGFDDSMASWGKGKHLDQRCGQTWLDTFAIINKFYSQRHQLDAVIIPTWNDYEEGTAIEPGIASCVRLTAEYRGNHLHWDVDGPRDTIDHFAVMQVDAGSTRLIQEVGPKEKDLKVPEGQTYIVEGIGRPSIQNVFSNTVRAEK